MGNKKIVSCLFTLYSYLMFFNFHDQILANRNTCVNIQFEFQHKNIEVIPKSYLFVT